MKNHSGRCANHGNSVPTSMISTLAGIPGRGAVYVGIPTPACRLTGSPVSSHAAQIGSSDSSHSIGMRPVVSTPGITRPLSPASAAARIVRRSSSTSRNVSRACPPSRSVRPWQKSVIQWLYGAGRGPRVIRRTDVGRAEPDAERALVREDDLADDAVRLQPPESLRGIELAVDRAAGDHALLVGLDHLRVEEVLRGRDAGAAHARLVLRRVHVEVVAELGVDVGPVLAHRRARMAVGRDDQRALVAHGASRGVITTSGTSRPSADVCSW